MPPSEPQITGTTRSEAPDSRLIEAARENWIDRLIDLSRRNNLLFYKPVLSGTIDIPDGSSALDDLLAGDAVPAQKLLPDALDRPARVLNIARKAMENLEEKGLQTLYLGLGFATWKADDGGRDVKAPIFMLPVSFHQKGRDVSSVEIEVAGEAQVNPVLLHVLDSEFDVQLTEEELLPADDLSSAETDGGHIAPYLAAFAMLAERAQKIPGFATLASAVIGNFAFAKLAMVNDLKESGAMLSAHAMIAAIAGDDAARAQLATSQIDVDPHTLDLNPPDEEFCVVEADSSQQCAINGIAVGQSAVVHGPPGTGKSQTITNLIATLVGNGKTVLFVAEKRAALEVVQRRLKASGLDHLAMDLHGAEISPKKVMERIARTLAAVRNAPQPHAADVHRQFVDRRSKLNGHDQKMHTVSPRSGKTVYAMQGALLRLPPESQTTVRWRGAELAPITPHAAEQIHDLLREAAGFEGLLLRNDPSPWTGVAFRDGRAVQEAIDVAQRLAHENLPALRSQLVKMERALGFRPTETIDQAGEVIEVLKATRALLSDYAGEVFTTDVEALSTEIGRAGSSGLKAFWLGLVDAKYKVAVRRAVELRHQVKAPARKLHTELREAARIAGWWSDRSQGASLPGVYTELDHLERAFSECSVAVAALETIVGQAGWKVMPLDALAALAERFMTDSSTPYRLLRLTEIETKLNGFGLQRLLDDLRNRKPSSSGWRAIFDHAWLNSALDELAVNDPSVKGFVGTAHTGYVDDFKHLDRDRLKAATARVMRAHAERAIAAMNAHPEQETLIKQEAAKSRRHKPLRVLFRDAGDVMTAVCPCWMASPLSVSQLIDRSAKFDYVVFDEASQVLPEDAVPSIMRGKFVVVAGDNKQLPPTGFFSAGIDEEGEIEVVDGYESLLDMMLPFAKSFYLNWHYRSRDESLIAFSNHHIYDDRLVTFPGPGGPPAVTHVLVDHIPESDGQEDSSSAEVKRVVELVIRHVQATPARTLGVITMGIKHAMRVQVAMDGALKAHPELHEFFDTERQERFFIKNLERVQGDERDSIIMSVGYGKDRAGNLPLRFGPILSEGGRRRLNVAVTRARETMTVVSSFAYTDIDTTKVRAGTGLEFLRNYLQYAGSEGKILAHGELSGEPMNDFEADVCDTLTARGMKIVPQVGCSSFRIDFGVCHPTEPGRFVLAVECDGATYHSSYTARDRDRLRQQQLENLGWSFHRIWSTDWFMRKHEEVERAWAAYQSAIARSDEKCDLSVLPALEDEVPVEPDVYTGPELTTQRSSLFPPIAKRSSITDYTRSEMAALYDWVSSDGKLRTHEELADEMFEALPFARRGARIEAVLMATIKACELAGRAER
jgi:very-short-patch-repair endonuclease